MAGPGNILIRVGADAAQAVSELSKVDRSLGKTMTASEKMSAGLKKAAIPAAAALTGIVVASVHAAKAAAEDAAAQEHLAGMLKRTTGASDAQIASTEDWISKVSLATGVADDDLRPALEKIATATHDITKAQKYLGQAMDISAASGKDLSTVSTAIAKGATGQTAALSKLIPGLSESAKKSKDFHVIMKELAQTTGGAAAESADTAAGQYKVLTNQMRELEEELGKALLPVIDALLPILRKLADFAADNTTAIKILVGVVAALAGGILIANAALKVYEATMLIVQAATKTWTAIQWLLNAALEANPIGLAVVALGLLVAALVVAYKKSETFRDIVDGALGAVKTAAQTLAGAFDAVKSAATEAFNWVLNHWKLALFAFGPIGAAIYLISENFDAIKGAATTAYNFIVNNFKLASFAFGPIMDAVHGIAGAFNAIWRAVNRVIEIIKDLIDWLSKIHVPSIHLPHIPGLPGRAAPAVYGAARGVGVAPAAATPGGITVNVYGAVDPEGTARAIRRVLVAHDRRQGRLV